MFVNMTAGQLSTVQYVMNESCVDVVSTFLIELFHLLLGESDGAEKYPLGAS